MLLITVYIKLWMSQIRPQKGGLMNRWWIGKLNILTVWVPYYFQRYLLTQHGPPLTTLTGNNEWLNSWATSASAPWAPSSRFWKCQLGSRKHGISSCSSLLCEMKGGKSSPSCLFCVWSIGSYSLAETSNSTQVVEQGLPESRMVHKTSHLHGLRPSVKSSEEFFLWPLKGYSLG